VATFLLYGLWDEWWHGLYRYDVMVDSPPHIGLLSGNLATFLGVTMTFAAARHERWGRVGVVASLGLMVAFVPFLSDAFQRLGQGLVDWVVVCVSCLTALLLLMAMALFRRPGSALLVAVAVAMVQALLWLFTPWATEAYADSVGLPMRDFVATWPILPSWIPMTVVVAALFLEGARALARSRRWSARVVTPICGAVASAVLAGLIPVQQALLNDVPLPGFIEVVVFVAATCLAAAVLGAPAGVAAWRLGLMLRGLDRPKATTAESGTAASGATA
jgi:hypothetical protein